MEGGFLGGCPVIAFSGRTPGVQEGTDRGRDEPSFDGRNGQGELKELD